MNSEYKAEFDDYKLSHKADLMNLRDFHLEGYYKEIIKLSREKSSSIYREMDKVVEPNQFYLIVSGVSPKTSYYKNNEGKLFRVKPTIHTGMFQDSVLYCEYNEVDVRYFPKFSSIEFYHISNNVKSIVIKNFGHDISYIKPFSHEEIQLKHGGELHLKEEDFRDIEGLMSPDCVDGKSMLSDLIDYAKEHGTVNEIEESADTVDDDIDYDEEGGDEDIFAGFKNFEYSDPDPDYDYVKARIFNSLLLKRLERGKIDRETYHKACESTYMDNPKLNYLKWLR